MDFLNQTMRWLSVMWRGLSTAGRVILVLAVVLGGIVVGYANRSTRIGTEAWLFGGAEFTASDLARMEAAFGKARLAGGRIEGPRISVPAAQKDLYLKALVDQQALPETFYSAQQRALDRDHPFTSQRQRDSWMKLAREQEVALIVRKIKGIEEVCVQYDDSEAEGFPRRKKRRATVAVRAAEGRPVEPEMVRAIRSTVMAAVGASAASDVTVLDLNVGRAYSGGDEDAVRQVESDYATSKRKHEEFYQAKIGQRLEMYPGAVVAVNVELERAADEVEGPAPLVPREVTASVALPQSTLVELWRRTRPEFAPRTQRPPTAFELRRIEDDARSRIREAVAALLPQAAVEGIRSRVSVESFPDTVVADRALTPSSPPWHAALADKEWHIAAVLLVLTLLLWRASRLGAHAHHAVHIKHESRAVGADRTAPSATRRTALRAPGAVEVESTESATANRQEVLREQLSERFQDDPRAATETLKQWLGNTASPTR